MTFVSPLWWWGLGGLAVPLLIHLLSRGRRQRIVMGSIRHLQGAESRALRRLKLSGWLQLLVRALLLAAMVFALTGPRWMGGSGAAPGGWVLVDPELVALAESPGWVDSAFGRRLESAREGASTVRLLTQGLPEWTESQQSLETADGWSLLREVDELAPAGASIRIFTTDRVGWLHGRRPSIARPVSWEVYDEQRPNRWIQRARVLADGDFEVTVGESVESGTRFVTHVWSADEPPPTHSGLRLTAVDETLELIDTGLVLADARVSIPEVEPPLRVSLSAEPHASEDAWYIERAVESISSYLERDLSWVEGPGSSADLEIRLGWDGSPDSNGPVQLVSTEPVSEPCQGQVYASSMLGDPWLRLQRCSQTWPPEMGSPWWQDGWGRPFISQDLVEGARIYAVHGRLSTSWSSLAVSPILPRLLLDLVAPDHSAIGGAATEDSDRRAMTGEERLPGRAETPSEPSGPSNPLPETLAWVLVGLLLVVERWLAGRVG